MRAGDSRGCALLVLGVLAFVAVAFMWSLASKSNAAHDHVQHRPATAATAAVTAPATGVVAAVPAPVDGAIVALRNTASALQQLRTRKPPPPPPPLPLPSSPTAAAASTADEPTAIATAAASAVTAKPAKPKPIPSPTPELKPKSDRSDSGTSDSDSDSDSEDEWSAIPHPDWTPSDAPPPTASRAFCVTGSHPYNRSCAFEGLCYDFTDREWTLFDQPNSAAASDWNRRSMAQFTGDPSAGTVMAMSVQEERAFWRPRVVRREPIPSGAAAATKKERVVWVDEPSFLLWRHQPENWAHSWMDDVFASYWLQRTWFYRRPPSAPADAAAYYSDGMPRRAVARVLLLDEVRYKPEVLFTVQNLQRVAAHAVHVNHNLADLIRPEFHTKPEMTAAKRDSAYARMRVHSFKDSQKLMLPPYDPKRAAGGAVRYMCFRRFAAGHPGATMQRNEGYDLAPSRTFTEPALIPGANPTATTRGTAASTSHGMTVAASGGGGMSPYERATRDFVRYVRRAYELPAAPPAALPATDVDWSLNASFTASNGGNCPPILWHRQFPNPLPFEPLILILNRPAGNSRHMGNGGALAEALRLAFAPFGIRVKEVTLETAGAQPVQAGIVADESVVVTIGVHGAHLWNTVFLTPGSWIVEFHLGESPHELTWRYFRWPARSLQLNHDSALLPGKYKKDSGSVDVPINTCVARVARALRAMNLMPPPPLPLPPPIEPLPPPAQTTAVAGAASPPAEPILHLFDVKYPLTCRD